MHCPTINACLVLPQFVTVGPREQAGKDTGIREPLMSRESDVEYQLQRLMRPNFLKLRFLPKHAFCCIRKTPSNTASRSFDGCPLPVLRVRPLVGHSRGPGSSWSQLITVGPGEQAGKETGLREPVISCPHLYLPFFCSSICSLFVLSSSARTNIFVGII